MSEYLGFGSDLLYGDTADIATAATYTSAMSELIDIKPPAFDADSVGTKYLKSTAQYETTVAGWGKAGEITFKGHFTPAEYNTLAGFHRVPKSWKVTFGTYTYGGGSSSSSATGNSVKVNGWLKTLNPVIEIDGLIEVEGTIQTSGKPTIGS